MKIQISESAYDDLDRGYLFYESQRESLGNYFQESLFSDIDSLKIYAGIILNILTSIGFYQKGSLLLFIIR